MEIMMSAQEREARILSLKAEIASFDNTEFGEMPVFVDEAGEPVYGYSKITVDKLYSHPRLWVNEKTLPTVIRGLSDEEHKIPYEKLDVAANIEYDGRLGPRPEDALQNFRAPDLAKVEALAFKYLVTSDELYGYTAIKAAKNFIMTIELLPRPWTGVELFRISNMCSATMGVVAEVYDWCYDLLRPEDKEFFVRAVTTRLSSNLEVSNPPKNTGCVTGHSTHILTLRDWPSFAVAVADEHPEIYNYIAGLVENYYGPPVNWTYRSGANFQGTTYGVNKSYLHMLSEIIFGIASGEKIYADNVSFEHVALTYAHYIRPDGEMMRISDVNFNGNKYVGKEFTVRMTFYASAYYKNPVLKAWALCYSNDFADVGYYNHLELTPTKVLIMNDTGIKVTHEDRFNLPPINYNGSPFGSVTARSEWGKDNAWFAFTKIGEAYQANHDHKEAGTFQIYYKGILAPNSVTYNYNNYQGTCYGDFHDYTYAKQVISKNGLLIRNPKYEGLVNKWEYCGAQRIHDETLNKENPTLEDWLNKSTSHQATELGHAWSYGEDGVLDYAYIAGDITNAYYSDTAELVMRSTLAINTGNEAHPLLFIVYDRISTCDASFKKTYLLHTTGAPVFYGDASISTDADGIPTYTGVSAFTYTNALGAAGSYSKVIEDDKYDGRLTNTTLLPENPTITVIGGDGKRFWVNGRNLSDEVPGELTKQSEVGWGRVEICPAEQNVTDAFLNVMYVGDADRNDPYVAASLVKANTHDGAISFGKCAMFTKQREPISEKISFNVCAEGDLDYYVTGLAEGVWSVSVDGRHVADVNVEAKSGIAVFTAPAGEVSCSKM